MLDNNQYYLTNFILYFLLIYGLEYFTDLDKSKIKSTSQKCLNILHSCKVLMKINKNDDLIQLGKRYSLLDIPLCVHAYPRKISVLRSGHHIATRRIMQLSEKYKNKELSKIYYNIEKGNLVSAVEYIHRNVRQHKSNPNFKYIPEILAISRGLTSIKPRLMCCTKLGKFVMSDKRIESKIDKSLFLFLLFVSYTELISTTGHLKRGITDVLKK